MESGVSLLIDIIAVRQKLCGAISDDALLLIQETDLI